MNVQRPMPSFRNPFKPGAGHMPPYLAGREDEQQEFRKLLDQHTILQNLVLTGLRGVGKTVLLETFKPLAIEVGWLWAGADLSESTSVTEQALATRLITDVALVTSSMVLATEDYQGFGFDRSPRTSRITLDYETLWGIYESTPGLVLDKLRRTLEVVSIVLSRESKRGLIFAYDEAQNLQDHAEKDHYPLSLLLDLFQSLQRRDVPFMLVLTGLPTLFPKLVEARTFAERMFHVMFLEKLGAEPSRDAIVRPVQSSNCPVKFKQVTVDWIVQESGGYPYFIQFICREVFDVWIQKIDSGEEPSVPRSVIVSKLDTDFFAGRWARATDRQRDLLTIAASLDNADDEFTVQEIVARSKAQQAENSFSSSHVNQMLAALSTAGLIYKNRHGKYSFAVPLLAQFIRRQQR